MGAERDAALTSCMSVVRREGRKEGEQSADTNHSEEDKTGPS